MSPTTSTPTPATPTLFDRAAQVFDGWTDPETGARVRRVFATNLPRRPGLWSTMYHQFQCFLDGGRQVLLHTNRKGQGPEGSHTYAVDLTTGIAHDLSPPGYRIREVNDTTHVASLQPIGPAQNEVLLWDLQAGRELARMTTPPGWQANAINLVSDGRRAIVFNYRGKYYTERVDSRHYLLTPGEEPRLIMDAEYFYCSHVVSCPTDPNLYTYDRWPSPKRDIDQAITIRALDGTFAEPVKLNAAALRPTDMFGARDHYVWTPDGRYIVSYLFPHASHAIPFSATPDPNFNHFLFEWWLSATDWRTGVDFCAKYPPGRWGGHMQITPDSRYILAAGGPGFDKLFAVDIAALAHGWNEHAICSYPQTTSVGNNADPFPYPFALPDGSGVIFTAGWPGPDHGVYLAEWPKSLR